MIYQNRNKEPFINFGFNKLSFNSFIDTEITIWQEVIYNKNYYDISISAIGGSILENNYNKAIVTYSTLGSYNIEVTISEKEKRIVLESNTLTINIGLPTADSNVITADSATILASG